MVVVHFFRNLILGGCQTLALGLSKELAKDFYQYAFVFTDQLDLQKDFESVGVVTKRVPQNKKDIAFLLKEIERNHECKLVIMSWFSPISLRLCPREFKHVVHIGTAHFFKKSIHYLSNFITLHSRSLDNARFVFCSKHAKTSFEKAYFFYNKKYEGRVIYNGVDTDFFYPSSQNKKNFTAAFIGRLDGSKDPEMIIRQAENILKATPNIEIFIIGGGVFFEELRKKAEPYSFIKVLGVRKNINKILENTDVFIFPNTKIEGFGNVVAEAMAMKIPSIVNNIGVMPEIVDHEKNGFLLDCESQLSLYLKILYDDYSLRKNMGEDARQAALKKFNIQNTIKLYRDAIES